jgi:hypothetical protein
MGSGVRPQVTQPPSFRPGGEYPPSPVPREVFGRARDTFFIEIDTSTTTGLVVGFVQLPLSFTVDADADVVVTGGAVRITTLADLTTETPTASVFAKFKRTGAGRDIQNDFAPIQSLLGTAQRPARWEAPMLLRSNSQLQVTLASRAAATVVVWMTLYGYKVFNA